jgi:hypothetical protein
MKKYLSLSFLAVLVLFSLMGGVQNARATDDPTPTYVTTLPASDMTTTDATLHAINGDLDADGHSFWVSTSSSFDISTPNIPAGVYSTIDLGFISSTTPFSASLPPISQL